MKVGEVLLLIRRREKSGALPLVKGELERDFKMMPYDRKLKQPSRQLRVDMTEAERRLWTRIRMGQLKGYQFYRQKPLGDYIVDFYCPRAKMVVEVDGKQHFSVKKAENDRARDKYLNSLGLRVLRYSNSDVLKHTERVVESIGENLE